MDFATLATTAVTYLITSLKNSKGGSDAADELSTSIWTWIKPIFLKDDEPLKDLEKNPDNEDNKNEVLIKIKKYLEKNPNAALNFEKIIDKLNNNFQHQINQQHYGSGDNIAGNKIINNG